MGIESLYRLFAPGALLRDADGDGIIDGVGARLHVTGGLPVWAGALDLAARLGLESTGLSLPLTGEGGDVTVRIGPGLAGSSCGLILADEQGGLTITGPDDASVRHALQYLAARYPYVGAIGGAELPAGTTALQVGPAGLAAYQVGERWTQVAPDAAGGVAVAAGVAGPAGAAVPAGAITDLAALYTGADEIRFYLDPALSPAELAAVVELAARFGVERSSLRLPLGALAGEEGGSAFPIRVTPGGGSVALTADGLAIAGLPAIRYLAAADLAELERRIAQPAPPAAEELQTELTYQDQWEVERFWQLWRAKVKPGLTRDRPVTIDLRLSEPLAVRQSLREQLLAELPAGSVVRVRSAFKQGLHWIEEEVLPALRGLGGRINRIDVAFQRFVGSAPAGESALELPTRWLQECYPADLLLARDLGIAEDAVAFTMAETGPTYRLTAYDANEQLIYEGTFDAITGSRRYLDQFPDRGWVHPPTGGLWVDGQFVAQIATDGERFWQWYQSAVLPTLRAWVVGRHGERPGLEAQPLFGTLRFDVRLSEDDRRLGIREEIVSPLDGLHEDIYFVTLDYMATWGRELHGQPFGAPGTILPFIHQGEGQAPEARVSLSWRSASVAPSRAALTGLTFGSAAEPVAARLADGRAVAIGKRTPSPVDLAEPAAAVTLDEVIGPDQLPAQLAYVKGLPGVRVWQAGVSYLGRPCYAIDLRLPVNEQILPPAKASAMKPTLVINARHHANEVSSTNAVLRLVERAAQGDPELVRFLHRVNVVINPLENMDGAATHYAMMTEHPTWKLHSARFNAVGLEFSSQYTDLNTPYTEARVLQDLFAHYRPDLYLDDHGVPSHEWLQPFAGYNSAPYFRVSYWLPNALLYGIFRQPEAGKPPHQAAATDSLRRTLTRRVRANSEVYDWNQAYLQTYHKWGVHWEPQKFPEEIHDGMICYSWPGSPNAFSVRFPETCVVDWVTEVPDETAQGEQLRLTIAAHLEGDIASMEFLAAHPQPVHRSAQAVADGVSWSVGRSRPFQTGLGES